MLSADRDIEKTRLALEEWLASRLPEADGVSVPELIVPEGTGFSNETLVFDLAYREDGDEQVRSLVARLQVPEATVFPDLDVARQAEVLRCVGEHTDVPVPEVLWREDDPAVLGTPFFVMEKVEGRIPTDVPSYNDTGFIAEMTPAERRALWESAVDKMARVHATDVEACGVRPVLDRPDDGPSGLPQLLAYLRRYEDWALRGRPYPTADRAWAWLMERVPEQPERLELCWGDARFSNMIFSGTECVAVLDWEMAVLGRREQDLGWWLYFDRFSAEGYGVERLEGLPGRQESIEHYERVTGTTVDPDVLSFYEVLAGYYFLLIMVRVSESLGDMGLLEPDSDYAFNNGSTELMERVLDEKEEQERREQEGQPA